jgi:uncharacterized membrane protein
VQGGAGGLQPDALIKLSSSANYIGDDIYNTTGASQSLTKMVAGKAKTFNVKIQNDGSTPDSMSVLGCRTSGGFAISYIHEGTNVTSQVVAGTFTTGSLAVGADDVISLKMRPKNSVTSGKKKACLVTVTSDGDPSKKDAVKATARVK